MSRLTALLSLALVLTAFAGLGLFTSSASADELIESDPHQSETLDHSPESILLTFDEPLLLEPGANSAAIVTAEGERIDDGNARIAGYSSRSLIVQPAPGEEIEGEVAVYYVVTFVSGESLTGAVDFAVDEHFVAPVLDIESTGPPRTSQSIVLWTLAILFGVALFTLLGYYLRFATDNARSSIDLPEDDHH